MKNFCPVSWPLLISAALKRTSLAISVFVTSPVATTKDSCSLASILPSDVLELILLNTASSPSAVVFELVSTSLNFATPLTRSVFIP